MLKLRTHFNTTPAEYDRARGGHLERRRAALVRAALAHGGARNVLEIGSGTGRLLAQLAAEHPDVAFFGIDVAPEMVAYAHAERRLPNLRYAVADIAADALPATYEFAYSIDVLHHIHDPLACLRAVRRALAPGGRWLIVEPNILHPYIYVHQERMRRAGFDEDHFRPWRFEPLMREAGFTIASRRYASLFPGGIERLPPVLERVERALERFRFIGGSVVYLLRAPDDGRTPRRDR